MSIFYLHRQQEVPQRLLSGPKRGGGFGGVFKRLGGFAHRISPSRRDIAAGSLETAVREVITRALERAGLGHPGLTSVFVLEPGLELRKMQHHWDQRQYERQGNG